MSKIKIDSSLEKLKSDYDTVREKFNLPSFSQLNEEFEIERIAEHETDMLLREIRKAITEKAVAFLRFLELMINPTAAPFFLLSVIRYLGASDKKLVQEIYRKVCEFEIKAIALDMKYNEKAEAAFIKESLKKWQAMHSEFQEMSKAIDKAWNASFEKKERSYFG